MRAWLTRILVAAGPLATPVGLGLMLLAVFGASRLALSGLYLDRLRQATGLRHLFLLGFRVDLSVVCYAIAPLAVLSLVLPTAWARRRTTCVVLPGVVLVLLAIALEFITPSFVDEYDERPNRLVLELFTGPREILTTLWSDYKLELAGLAIVLGLSAWAAWRLLDRMLGRAAPWTPLRRALALPPTLLLLGLGARGTLGHRPANISTAAISSDRLVNELALNSTYSLAQALYSLRYEVAPEELYGSLSRERIFAAVAPELGATMGHGIPFLHRVAPTAAHPPCNLVVVVEESLGAGFVGALGGLPLTPNLDRLAARGLLFTNLYGTGTRTARGIEAILSGFLPTPGRSVVKLALAQRDFFTVAELLRRQGYHTEFIYGGESHFDNMRSFFLGNGFEEVHDEPSFTDAVFHGTWGVSDEDLFREANERFVAHGERPFFALILTTSNHKPFEFPDGRIELYEEPKATRHNAIKYADHALGEFFRLAEREDYYPRTIFVVVADHDVRTYGRDLVPVSRFHIPGLILGPGVEPGRLETVASQIDLLPTTLPLLGLALEHPMIGRNLLALPAGEPGRAIMQFDRAHGFMVGDRVVVHLPHERPRFFRYVDERLEPMPEDETLRQQGLAHAILPGLLYRERRYRLP